MGLTWNNLQRLTLTKIKRRLTEPLPEIRLESFTPEAYLTVPEDDRLRSEIARSDRVTSAPFKAAIDAMYLPQQLHRKNWELGYIHAALAERGVLKTGARGLAFAVGQERLPALFAALGCTIVATDLDGTDDRHQCWAETSQWVGNVEGLTFPEICPSDVMAERVSYRPVDMNKIPDDLRDFDFTWSTCSFEHCGSLQLGADFMVNQMACLKPGGVAVHTTEFNLSSNEVTKDNDGTVIYRLKDIEALVARLEEAGHHVEPLDMRLGNKPADRHVDRVSIFTNEWSPNRHMRVKLATWASTSVGLIVRKDGLAHPDLVPTHPAASAGAHQMT